MKKSNLIVSIVFFVLAILAVIFGITVRGQGFLDLSFIFRYASFGLAILFLLIGGLVAFIGKK